MPSALSALRGNARALLDLRKRRTPVSDSFPYRSVGYAFTDAYVHSGTPIQL